MVTPPLAGAHLPGDTRETPARPQERGEAVDGECERGATTTQGAETVVMSRTSSGAATVPTVRTSVTPRAVAGTGFRSLAGQRSRFLAETRALVVPVLREALGDDPLITDAVLDGIATSAAYPLWRTLDIRITVPDHLETRHIEAWAEGDSHLSFVRGPVERVEVIVSTQMGPLPESLPERYEASSPPATTGWRTLTSRPWRPACERPARSWSADGPRF